MKQTVTNPTGLKYPKIYGNPRELAAEAATRVAKESKSLKRLFGVTRAEMYERGAHREGNMEPDLKFPSKLGKNTAAKGVINPENKQRLQDVLAEAQKHEGLKHGMMPWYYMDPAYNRLEELVGPKEAVRRYNQMNHMTGMSSPGSSVNTEINRGLAADYLAEKNRFNEFVKYGGQKLKGRSEDFPQDISRLKSHPYHTTSHTGPMQRYMDAGDLNDMKSIKVPAYIPASGVPQTGFQTKFPVADAHFTRFLGMSDTRGGADTKASMLPREYHHVAPWFRDEVAKPMGMEAVPGQALTWGAGSGATGVKTAIGKPKLEILADHIMQTARYHGISPENARDKILKGDLYNRGGVVDRALRVAKKPPRA